MLTCTLDAGVRGRDAGVSGLADAGIAGRETGEPAREAGEATESGRPCDSVAKRSLGESRASCLR